MCEPAFPSLLAQRLHKRRCLEEGLGSVLPTLGPPGQRDERADELCVGDDRNFVVHLDSE